MTQPIPTPPLQAETPQDISALLFIQLCTLTDRIKRFQSFVSAIGFISYTRYHASHVAHQSIYTPPQWLADYFANKISPMASFLTPSPVPASTEAATKMLTSFLQDLQTTPMLTEPQTEVKTGLFDALRTDIETATASKKLLQGRSVEITPMQKQLALELLDSITAQLKTTSRTMQQLLNSYKNAPNASK